LIVKTCDVCKRETTELVDLLDAYKTADIKQVCGPCETKINKQWRKINEATSKIRMTWVHGFIEQMKRRFST
jgi:hypothetical protein